MIHSLNVKGFFMATPNFPESEALEVLRYAEKHSSQSTLAQEIGYSVGKVNYILKALIEKGLIKAERFAKSENKKGYMYLLTTEGIKHKLHLTEKFVQIKKREYEKLQEELEKLQRETNEK
jgi:EPS-associated MarR family transcriptional regulator